MTLIQALLIVSFTPALVGALVALTVEWWRSRHHYRWVTAEWLGITKAENELAEVYREQIAGWNRLTEARRVQAVEAARQRESALELGHQVRTVEARLRAEEVNWDTMINPRQLDELPSPGQREMENADTTVLPAVIE